MSVRKRIWLTINGATRVRWVVSYVDADGKRKFCTFDKRREAQEFWDERVVVLPPRSAISRVLVWLEGLEDEMRSRGNGDTGKLARTAIDALEKLT